MLSDHQAQIPEHQTLHVAHSVLSAGTETPQRGGTVAGELSPLTDSLLQV